MQTAQVLRLADDYRYRDRRGGFNRARPGRRRERGSRPTHLRAVASTRAPSRKTGRGARHWFRPIAMAIMVAGEWLLLIADVFVRVYIIA